MRPIAYISAVVLGWTLMQGPALADDRPRVSFSKPQSPSLEAGRKAVDAKDFKAALGHLAKAVEETPDDADVHNLLGYSFRKVGQFEKAMEHYRRALSIDPQHRGAHEYMGELYLEMGQSANAEKQLQALYKACPWFGRCEEYDDLKEALEKYKAKGK